MENSLIVQFLREFFICKKKLIRYTFKTNDCDEPAEETDVIGHTSFPSLSHS